MFPLNWGIFAVSLGTIVAVFQLNPGLIPYEALNDLKASFVYPAAFAKPDFAEFKHSLGLASSEFAQQHSVPVDPEKVEHDDFAEAGQALPIASLSILLHFNGTVLDRLNNNENLSSHNGTVVNDSNGIENLSTHVTAEVSSDLKKGKCS